MPAPRKVTDAQIARLCEVGRRRLALGEIPSDKQLARELGLSHRTVMDWMWRLRKTEFTPRSRKPKPDLDALARELEKPHG